MNNELWKDKGGSERQIAAAATEFFETSCM